MASGVRGPNKRGRPSKRDRVTKAVKRRTITRRELRYLFPLTIRLAKHKGRALTRVTLDGGVDGTDERSCPHDGRRVAEEIPFGAILCSELRRLRPLATRLAENIGCASAFVIANCADDGN